MINTSPTATLRPQGSLRREEAVSLSERAQELMSQSVGGIVIDLGSVDQIDSSGLSSLITIVTQARLRDTRVVLAAPNAFVAGLLRVTRLDGWFEVYPTMDEALQAVSAV